MAKPFLLGALAALALEAVIAVLVVASGVVDVAATRSAGIQDRILGYASTRAIARHARDEPNPLARDAAALASGLEQYRAMCVACHGGPGATPEEFAAGLHPAAPDLASPQVQSFTDGMLYETVARGIGSTGMPAFGPGRQPKEIWSIVAFVRHLPALTPQERISLARKDSDAAPEEPPANAAPSPQRVHRVAISGFEFKPSVLEVRPGDTIEWKNEDLVAHTASADDRSFDTGKIDAERTKRVVAKAKGRFPYFCRYHTSMKGTIVVR